MEDGGEGRRGNVDLLGHWRSSANNQLAQELRATRHVGSKDLSPSIWYCSFMMCLCEVRPVWAQDYPPLSVFLPHFLLYLLVSFTFPYFPFLLA